MSKLKMKNTKRLNKTLRESVSLYNKILLEAEIDNMKYKKTDKWIKSFLKEWGFSDLGFSIDWLDRPEKFKDHPLSLGYETITKNIKYADNYLIVGVTMDGAPIIKDSLTDDFLILYLTATDIDSIRKWFRLSEDIDIEKGLKDVIDTESKIYNGEKLSELKKLLYNLHDILRSGLQDTILYIDSEGDPQITKREEIK